jgi:hypothetical protein
MTILGLIQKHSMHRKGPTDLSLAFRWDSSVTNFGSVHLECIVAMAESFGSLLVRTAVGVVLSDSTRTTLLDPPGLSDSAIQLLRQVIEL